MTDKGDTLHLLRIRWFPDSVVVNPIHAAEEGGIMPRLGRLKFTDADAWYHLYSRIAAFKGDYPLSESVPMRCLIQTIEHYSAIYFCEVAAFCVMGNHYHLVARFDQPREVSRDDLRARTRLMYPSRASQRVIDGWSEEDWGRYRRRLFDVSEFMRNVQSSFARWYNRTYERRGRFWAERFKSTFLQDKRAVLDCMLYVELNPVRAGLVERPEEWHGSSLLLRELGKDAWLTPLREFVEQTNHAEALLEYRQRLYYRGSVPTRAGQRTISQEVLDQEIARGFATTGLYRKRLGYFVDGLAIGTEGFIRDQLSRLREEGRYLRRKNPIPQLGGIHLSLREQRSSPASF
jgi:putative transposase